MGLLHARYDADGAASGCKLHWKVTSPELLQANCAVGLVITPAGADVMVVAGPCSVDGNMTGLEHVTRPGGCKRTLHEWGQG